jgi:hypothetical protein
MGEEMAAVAREKGYDSGLVVAKATFQMPASFTTSRTLMMAWKSCLGGTPQDDGLIGVGVGDGAKFREEVVVLGDETVQNDGAVLADVDDDLAGLAILVLRLLGRGHGNVHVALEAGELPGHDEENEELEDDVDHRRELELGGLLTVDVAESHRLKKTSWSERINRRPPRRGEPRHGSWRVCTGRRAGP